MATNRTRKRRAPRQQFTPQVIAAWQRGDAFALHDLLDLPPWSPCPLPQRFGAYCLADEPPGPSSRCWDMEWPNVKRLQDALFEIAGEPGTRK